VADVNIAGLTRSQQFIGHGVGLGRPWQRGHHDTTTGRHVGDGTDRRRTRIGQRRHRGTVQVMDHDTVTGPEQSPDHGRAHGPGADHADRQVAAVPCRRAHDGHTSMEFRWAEQVIPCCGIIAEMLSVLNSLRIFEEVARHQPVALHELVDLTGLPTTTAHRALRTLEEADWVLPTANRRYVVNGRIRRLITDNPDRLSVLARDACSELRDATGESVSLALPVGDEVVIVEHWDAPTMLRVVQIEGSRTPIDVSASGKACLAKLGSRARAVAVERLARKRADDERAAWIAQFTHELEVARAQGWSVVDGEWIEGVVQIGAAISDRGRPIAGIGVGLPTQRLTADAVARFGPAVHHAAQRISELLASPAHDNPQDVR
jgi:IclR family transcriptional regulator, acetate operon repressor